MEDDKNRVQDRDRAGEVVVNEKLCVFCKHWQFSGGSEHWSEYTPAINASMDCAKGHYGAEFELEYITEEGFRNIILKAETCPDYDPAIKETLS